MRRGLISLLLSMTAPFTVKGVKSFSVAHLDPVSGDGITASGTFKAKRKRSGKWDSWPVAGSLLGPERLQCHPQASALGR